MKKYILQISFTVVFFLNSMCMFAQPGDENPDGTLEGNDPVATPLENYYLSTLIFIGIIAFCYYKYFKSVKNSFK